MGYTLDFDIMGQYVYRCKTTPSYDMSMESAGL